MSVKLKTIYFTTKPLCGTYKGFTAGLEKSKVIYKFKRHYDGMYVGKIYLRFHLKATNLFQNSSEVEWTWGFQ